MVYDHQNWRAKASCKDLTVEQVDEIFFVSVGKSAKRARVFCGNCPVQRQCLNYALYYGEVGIWGGMTDNERKRLTSTLVGTLTRAQLQSIGVSSSETREQTEWGLGTAQINESRRKFVPQAPEPVVEPVPQPLNQQPPMLLIQL